jgi:3-oxoacyl-[acyl-carrier protein] reductase
MDLGLKDRVAVVAASSQGLGKAVARGLAKEGARLALCSRNAEALEATAQEIRRESNAEVMAWPVDVTKEEQVHAFVAQVQERFGDVDICVTNAGGPPAKSFDATTVADWRRAVDLNLMSTLFLAREVLPSMKARKWGRLVTITSLTVKQPVDGLILSNSVRAAVVGLVKSLSNEYAPFNVLVNNVCPGYTATDRLGELSSTLAKTAGVAPAEIEKRWTGLIPLGRLARPEEFADMVVFLCSERASYITGQSIAIDGGFAKGLM